MFKNKNLVYQCKHEEPYESTEILKKYLYILDENTIDSVYYMNTKMFNIYSRVYNCQWTNEWLKVILSELSSQYNVQTLKYPLIITMKNIHLNILTCINFVDKCDDAPRFVNM